MIVALSSILTLLGLWFVLRKYFTAWVALVSLLLLALGTNFFLMSVYSGAVQASILLALMTLVLWMTQRWYEKPGWVEAILIGLAAGCLVFIRPAGLAAIFLFFFWGAYNKPTFNEKWGFFRQHTQHLILVFSLFILGLSLRLIFPQAFEGTWFSDYMQHQRAVYLFAPWLWLVLCSIKNGWLIYTPLVLLALPGFNILAARNKKIFFGTFIFSLVFLILAASTPEIARPDNFSQSKLTELLAVLIIPIAFFICWVYEGRWFRKTLFSLVFAALITMNIFQTWQYRSRILNPWFMTPDYYAAVFMKAHADHKTRLLQDFGNMDMSSYLSNEADFNISTLVDNNFDNGIGEFGGHVQSDRVRNGKGAFRLDNALMFTPAVIIPLGTLPPERPLGIRLSAFVYTDSEVKNNPASFVITLRHKAQLYRYKPLLLNELELEKGKWNYIKLDYVIPQLYDPADELICNIWYPGAQALFVDDFKVEVFAPRE
ncbi:MAG: hypothetical protein WCO02_18380 [Bacteroidota bacterium]